MAERGQSIEGQVLELLAEVMAETSDRGPSISGLVSRFTEKHGAEMDRTMTGKWMGSILRKKLGLRTYRQAGMFYVSLKDDDKLRILFRRYGFPEDAAAITGL